MKRRTSSLRPHRTTSFGIRQNHPLFTVQLSLCANTCRNAAAAATGCNLTSCEALFPPSRYWHSLADRPRVDCICTNGDFQFKVNSCVQAECRADEFDTLLQQRAEACGVDIGFYSVQSLIGAYVPHSRILAPSPLAPLTNTFRLASFRLFPLSNSTDGSLLPAESLFITGRPTATAPFLPPNSNADIGSSKVENPVAPSPEISSSGGTSTATSSTSDIQPQLTSHQTASSSAVPTQPVHRNGAQTGAIAASLVAVILIGAVVLFLFWVRRRRQRSRERRVPEQFIQWKEHIVPEPVMMKLDAPASAESAEVVIPADSQSEESAGDEQMVTLRVRRLEAQFETLLSLGLPEDSPPRYSG
ncbi:hypothetical protein B0H19DRAFT_1270556 [Mycena capillaripes]|nr:hypothetical protein B0H19DRAFT_1270556 [Mycena capillaripes]